MQKQFVALAILFAIILSGCLSQDSKKFWQGEDGLLQAAAERGPVAASETKLEENENGTLYKISFESLDGKKIFALLQVPPHSEDGKLPAAVFEPGAGVAKEGGNIGLAKAMALAGFEVITIDQRGVGETGGQLPPMQKDFETTLQGGFAQQQLMVYDYLRAFDYLRARPEVDAGKILFAGESHGGRIAIIAGSIEPRAKAVMAVSTAGYGPQAGAGADVRVQKFIASIDPAYYVHAVSPRKIVFLHSQRDEGIPITAARELFDAAGEPKQFVEIPCEHHGYCDEIAGLAGGIARELVK